VAKSKNVERKAKIEQMRREQQRKERRRSMAILGACGVVVVALLAAALIPYINNLRKDDKLKKTALTKLGVPAASAGCSPVKKQTAEGNQQHITAGTPIRYDSAPPAFGKHWGNFLTGSEIRPFYTVSDRPEIERLVHSLEHGHTIIWYDDTITKGSSDYEALQQIVTKLGTDSYVMVAPWTNKDGASFPSGKHIAFTHWTGPDKQQGIWEYCTKASGSVARTFTDDYPKDNAPEPGAA
jgi:hypothetical protein